MRSGDRFRTRALSSALGVEVLDLPLDRDLAEDDVVLLRELFDTHHLLLFRGQQLSGEEQVRMCAHLRPVVDPIAWISNVEPGFHPEGELHFHSDYAFTAHPMLGLSLYAIELGRGAAPTLFANNARACRELDSSVREALNDLRVVHLIDSVNGRDNLRTRLDDIGGDEASPSLYPRFARPAIWTHPITGDPLLFVLQQQASHFEGWSCKDSDPLLDAAFEKLYDDANVYAHEWRVGDFVVWDNLALQHGRRANPNTVRRSLRRVAMNTVTTAELISGTGFDPAVRSGLAGNSGA